MKDASSSAQNLVLLALTLALLLALLLPVSSQQHGGGRSRTTEAIPAPRMGLGADPGSTPTPCPSSVCTPCPDTGVQPIGNVCPTPCPPSVCTPCPGGCQPAGGQCPNPCPTPTPTPAPFCGPCGPFGFTFYECAHFGQYGNCETQYCNDVVIATDACSTGTGTVMTCETKAGSGPWARCHLFRTSGCQHGGAQPSVQCWITVGGCGNPCTSIPMNGACVTGKYPCVNGQQLQGEDSRGQRKDCGC